MLEQYAWLIPLLPLLAALLIGVHVLADRGQNETGERITSRIALTATALSLLLLLGLDLQALLNHVPHQVSYTNWLNSGNYQVKISFTLDALGLSLATLFALLCLTAMRFSVDYMHREAGFHRFFLFLSLFSAAMLLITLAGNAVLVFIGWELAGISSYLLIAYAYDRPTATANATRAFVTNRIGDGGFILSMAFCFLWLGSVEWPIIVGEQHQLDTLHSGLVLSGFLLAAMAKSAQIPFAGWIAGALEGPTPSSAVFYGAVMVHAGVYLLIRLEPLLVQVPAVMMILVFFGLLTALYGWLASLVQSDAKSALMFSTTAQTGLMFVECGLGWFELAAWHLAAHAVLRAYQFLHAPALLHLTRKATRPAPAWLTKHPYLFNAALQRFWLDPVGDWLLVRPTRALSQDIRDFDQKVVNRIIGLPTGATALSSLSQYEKGKTGVVSRDSDIGTGSGAAGLVLQWFAVKLHWFEEHLVLKGSGEGLMAAIKLIGKYAMLIEQLLSQPRYLLLLIMATFVVII